MKNEKGWGYMNIKVMKLSELNPAKYNPRKALKPGDKEFEKLKNSIENFGYVELIVVNTRTGNTVISGHQRLSVLKHLGREEAECVLVDLDVNNEKALNIAMNKIVGEWDTEKLTNLLGELKAEDFDLSFTGFEPVDLEKLLGTKDEAKEDDFDVESELKQPAFSKPGDMWHLGKHAVSCGDSKDPETNKHLLGEVKVNLVCTEPPYVVNRDSSSGKITNDDLNDADALKFLMNAFSCFHEAMAKDASIYVFYATAKTRIFHDAFEDAGFKVGAGLVWKKDRLVLTRTDWKYIHEPIIWGWRKDGKHIWYGDQKQTTVFEFPRLKSSKDEGFGHPSSKPIPLIAYLIKQCTQTNGIVLDGFLGSASTLIACDQLDRVCYGVELEPKFVDVAVKRYCSAHDGRYDDVYVIRDGQKLKFEEVATFEAEVEGNE